MPVSNNKLGRLIAVYAISPAYMQRAVTVVVLSFLFFLSMMFAYYIRQSLLYFLLASGFMILYLLTMFSFVIQMRSRVEVFENGFKYKKTTALWNDIVEIRSEGSILLENGKAVEFPRSLHDIDGLMQLIKSRH